MEDEYLSPIVKVLRDEANVTEEAANQASQRSKEQHYQKNMGQARLFGLAGGNRCGRDTGALCIP